MTHRGRPDVLLVDDDPSITELLHRLLETECEVREAHGVCEALAAMGGREPDILVTDLEMDEGGGKYLLAAVTDEHPSVRRLVYSGALRTRLVCLVDGGLADAAVSKSEHWSVLVNEVRRLVSEVASQAPGVFSDIHSTLTRTSAGSSAEAEPAAAKTPGRSTWLKATTTT